MDSSKVLNYLLLGIVAGAVLFFAGFGLKSMFFGSENETPAIATSTAGAGDGGQSLSGNSSSAATDGSDSGANKTSNTSGTFIAAPEIKVVERSKEPEGPVKIKPLDSQNTDDANAAAASGNEVPEEPPVQFGTLQLNAVNAADSQPLNADFLIQDSENRAIAKLAATPSGKLSLPEGTYRITVTRDQVSMFRYLGVTGNQSGSETFELEMPEGFVDGNPAAIAGNQAAVAANSTAEQANAAGGSPSGDNTDNSKARTGVLRLSSLSKQGQRPLKSDFTIRAADGSVADSVSGVETHQFSLPAGTYTAVAQIGEVSVNKEVEVSLKRGLHQIFLIPEEAIEAANAAAASAAPDQGTNTQAVSNESGNQSANDQTAGADNGSQAADTSATASDASVDASADTDDSNAAATASTTEPATPAPQDANGVGRLELFAVRADNQAALRSNFYIQTASNNKLIASKTWVESIGYKLPVGKYLVTVRSNGFTDQRKIMTVREGQIRREVFRLK